MDNRIMVSIERNTIARRQLISELQDVYGDSFLSLTWRPPNAKQPNGEVQAFLQAGSDPQQAAQLITAHDPTDALNRQALRRLRFRNALQNLNDIEQLLDDDWTITPPTDALDILRESILDVVRIVRGLES